MTGLATGRVSPFGHPGITAHVQLPQAYRSLSRPSSPLDAKASTVCLIAFDLNFSCRVQPCDRAGTTGVDSSHPACSHPGTRKRAPARQQANHPFVDCQRAGRIPSRKREPGPAKKKCCELASGRVRATSEDFRLGASIERTRRSRKEVIQPQVPLRLPCYDFAPVTELTFDGCLSCELAHRLQVPPASMA